VIENKIYTPFSDMIVLEPAVSVHTKPRSVSESNESVKVDSVQVKMIEKLQETNRANKLVNMVASALSYTPSEGQTQTEIINESSRLNILSRLLCINQLFGK
jgi:hypothetical protein